MSEPSNIGAAPGAEPILRLRGVGRRFGGVRAVQGVDLEIRQGERRAVLGPNGAGKTTLFNVLTGRVKPDSGTVSLDAFVAYKFGNYRVALNAYNLTDRLNYVQSFGNRGVPAPGRTIIASIGFTY